MSKLTFNNVSLYIKRAELHLTSNFIINAFNNNNIGIVKEVKFTKKTDNSGKEYNGAIVVFERWFTNAKVNKLLDDMTNSEDGSTKFIYDKYGHYWYINIYTTSVLPEAQQPALVDETLPDKQRIAALENLLQNMTTQMHYMQTRNEFNERQLMEYEQKQTRHYLCNVEIRTLLEDKEFELDEAKNDFNNKLEEATNNFNKELEDVNYEFNKELEKVNQDFNKELYAHLGEISMLKCRLACIGIELVKKDDECNSLKQELRDQNCIINYLENEQKLNEQKLKLKDDEMFDFPDFSKMSLEELN
jgi:hypothetical protein